jgi:hypothetical protein
VIPNGSDAFVRWFDMRGSHQNVSTLLGLALGIASLGCRVPDHDTKLESTSKATTKTSGPTATPAAPPRSAEPSAGSLTLTSDDEFIANGREIVRRLVAIFTDDGQDCEKLAADISKLSEDPIWKASTHYEDAHPDVRERFAAEQAEMGKRFGAVAGPAATACANNEAFAAALARMR